MNAREHMSREMLALGVIEQLRDALKYADKELQRRCVISTKVREALGTADRFLANSRF